MFPERRYTDWKPTYENGMTREPAETFIQYGEVYRQAIERLLDSFRENEPMHDYSLLPVIQLLRHFIEITLKGIIYYVDKSKLDSLGHDIEKAYDLAIQLLGTRYGLSEADIGIEPEVEDFIRLLNRFDGRNQFARYPETRRGVEIRYSDMPAGLPGYLVYISKFDKIARAVVGQLNGLGMYMDDLKYPSI